MIRTRTIKTNPDLSHIYLIPLGDTHIGDEAGVGGYKIIKNRVVYNSITVKFKNMLDWIAGNPNVYTFLMGDIFDTALKNSKSDTYKSLYNLDDAKDYAVDLFRPLAKTGRLLGGIDGNHCDRLIREASNSLMKDLCIRLSLMSRTEVTYFDNMCAYLFLRVGNYKDSKNDIYRPYDYSVFLHHGRGGGRTSGAALNSVHLLAQMVPADVYVMGHVHKTISEKESYVERDMKNKKLNYRKRYYMISGCWLGWAGYAQKLAFPPPNVGVGRIRLNGEPKEHGWDIHVSI